MRFFTKEWYELQKKDVNARDRAAELYQKTLTSEDCQMMNSLLLQHDSQVIDLILQGETAILLLDPRGSSSCDTEIHFQNAVILENEGIKANDYWIDHEVYRVEGKWEIHILFVSEEDCFKYFTITASDIRFVVDEQKQAYQESLSRLINASREAVGKDKQQIEDEIDRLIVEYRQKRRSTNDD